MDSHTGARHGSRWLLRLLVVGIAFALPLVAAEIALRVYHGVTVARTLAALPPESQRAIITSADPARVFEFNPGWSRSDFQVNQLGLADDETTATKPEGILRIAIVGDSITANFWLEPREVIFATRLEELLARRPAPEGFTGFEVLNLGVNGYSAPQILAMARSRALELGADVIVAQLCLNDPFTKQQGYANAPPPYPLRLIGFVARRLIPERALARSHVDSRYTDAGWRNVERAVRGLAALSTEVPVLAVLVPYLAPPAYEQWGFGRFHEGIARIASDAGLPLLDLRDDFERAGLIDRSPHEDPVHPGPEGHALIAKRILDGLSDLNLLSPAREPGEPTEGTDKPPPRG